MNRPNLSKVATAGKNGITVYFTSSRKHKFYKYEEEPQTQLGKLLKEKVRMDGMFHVSKYQTFMGDNYQGKQYQTFHGDTYKGKQYQTFGETYFTSAQMRMYHDCIYGLNSYSMKQIKAMSALEKAEIHRKHVATVKVLEKWRQQLTSKLMDDLLSALFFKSEAVKQLIRKGKGYTDKSIDCGLTFKDLKIGKKQIAEKLVKKGLLPADFFQPAFSEAA